jgi:hypothetical protein
MKPVQQQEQEYLTIQQAAERLGVTRRHIRELVRAGKLSASVNPLDRRVKLIPAGSVRDLERFQVRAHPEREGSTGERNGRPWPKSIGAYTGPVDVPSDKVDEYLEARRQPE